MIHERQVWHALRACHRLVMAGGTTESLAESVCCSLTAQVRGLVALLRGSRRRVVGAAPLTVHVHRARRRSRTGGRLISQSHSCPTTLPSSRSCRLRSARARLGGRTGWSATPIVRRPCGRSGHCARKRLAAGCRLGGRPVIRCHTAGVVSDDGGADRLEVHGRHCHCGR